MTAQLPESLVRYLAERDAQRADDVRSILDALTPRERRLIQDAAVMGYVRGKMSGRDDPVPKDGVILGETVDACLTHRNAILFEVVDATLAFPDNYVVLTGVRPCGGCGHPEYVHEDAEEDDDETGTPGVCLQCQHGGAEGAHHDYRVVSPDLMAHGPNTVAYRSRVGTGGLRCLEHAPTHPERILDWMALTSDDLEDGGICSVCGRDVLIRGGR